MATPSRVLTEVDSTLIVITFKLILTEKKKSFGGAGEYSLRTDHPRKSRARASQINWLLRWSYPTIITFPLLPGNQQQGGFYYNLRVVVIHRITFERVGCLAKRKLGHRGPRVVCDGSILEIQQMLQQFSWINDSTQSSLPETTRASLGPQTTKPQVMMLK